MEESAFEATWQVGPFEVSLSLPSPGPETRRLDLRFQWSPHVPGPDELTEAQIEQYEIGRDAALSELQKRIGVKLIVFNA